MPVRIFAALLLLCSSLTAQPVMKHGRLQVNGTQLIDQSGQPIALHGVSFGWHNWWPRFYTAGTVDWLYRDWNCSVVRAAMGVEPDKGYIKDPAGSTQLVRTVVDAAIKSGIYVIIDWHSHNINLAEAKAFFREMATAYGKYPNVIYELFNEPDRESWKEVKDYSIELIRLIREIDPDNIILVGSPHWDQDIHLPAEDPITGFKNLMYSLHFYAGTHKQWLRDRADAAIAKGLPVFISESAGMEASGNGAIDQEEWQRWIDWMDARKLSWVSWSVSDKDETCSMLLPIAGSDGKWELKDLKEWGIRTRNYLRGYR
ncbi:MAG: glycoside hydrolase family 5 protein [Chitinophagaceae bacterium]|nr:glycoside hydrolase family 5 protein [Chitinophagaceae bacterium]